MASYANGEASASSSRQPVLRARARDVRTVASLLRPIAFTSICQVTISEPGLQIVTELNGVLQATAYIGCGMFDEFVYAPEPRDVPDDDEEEGIAVSTFDVSLSTWLSCLNIYGTAAGNFSSASSSDKDAGRQGVLAREPDFRRAPFARGKTVVEMTYAGVGHPLTLEIKDEKVTSRCELATFETNTTVISDMPYLAERTVGQVIMHSKQLTEALMSIDTSSRHVTFAFIDDPSGGGFTAGNDDRPPRTPIRAPAGGSRTVHVPPSSEMDTSDAADLFDTRAAYRAHRGSEMMRISAVGDTGSTELDFPNRNKVFESFSLRYPSQHTYAFANIQRCLRALQTSLKASIRIDDQGMMSLQCLFPDRPVSEREAEQLDEMSGPERRGFVEIRMLSVMTDDDV